MRAFSRTDLIWFADACVSLCPLLANTLDMRCAFVAKPIDSTEVMPSCALRRMLKQILLQSGGCMIFGSNVRIVMLREFAACAVKL